VSRELLYLDLALENVVRAAAERGAGKAAGAAHPNEFHIRYSCSLPLVEQPLLHVDHMGCYRLCNQLFCFLCVIKYQH